MINAIYLQPEWFNGAAALTDAQMTSYLQTLSDLQFTFLFCDVGLLADAGTLPAAGYSTLAQFITNARKFPNFKVIANINYGKRRSNANFGNSAWNSAVDAAIANLFTSFSIDGIHLDIEKSYDNDSTYLTMLTYFRNNSCQGKHMSLSCNDFWSAAYITQVAGLVDQMNIMLYDNMGYGSTEVDQKTYFTYYKTNLRKFCDAVDGLNVELLPCFPAYEKLNDGATPPVVYHDPVVENMRTAIGATQKVMAEGGKVDGAAVFFAPNFLGLVTNIYKQYPLDQAHWKSRWLKL